MQAEALVEHLQQRIAGLEAERAESDERWRRVVAALRLEGDPMDEVIVARVEKLRAEIERLRPLVRAARAWARLVGGAGRPNEIEGAAEDLAREVRKYEER